MVMFASQTLRQRRHEGVGENGEIMSHKRAEAQACFQPSFLGLSEFGGTSIPHPHLL